MLYCTESHTTLHERDNNNILCESFMLQQMKFVSSDTATLLFCDWRLELLFPHFPAEFSAGSFLLLPFDSVSRVERKSSLFQHIFAE